MAKQKIPKITATRDGVTRNFSKVSWDTMPDGNYGWAKVKAEVPGIVKANMAAGKPTT